MELVYTATRPRRSSRRDINFREESPLISLSTHNALALCTTVQLNDTGSNDRYVGTSDAGIYDLSRLQPIVIIIIIIRLLTHV